MSIISIPADEALFGKIRRELLSLFIFNPDRSFYLLQIVSLLRTGRGGVQRELDNLVSSGIVSRRRAGVKVMFSLNPECPHASSLRKLLQELVDCDSWIEALVSEFDDRIDAAVLPSSNPDYGPIPLLIIAGGSPEDIETGIERVKLLCGRDVNLNLFSPAGFIEAASGFRGEKWFMKQSCRFLKGSPDALRDSASVHGDETEGSGQDLFSSAGLDW
jgi:hypothetical protein